MTKSIWLLLAGVAVVIYPVRAQLEADQRGSRASVVRLVDRAAAAMGSVEGLTMQHSSIITACAVEEAPAFGANGVNSASNARAAQPLAAVLLVSHSASTLLLLDAGGSTLMFAPSLRGPHAACKLRCALLMCTV